MSQQIFKDRIIEALKEEHSNNLISNSIKTGWAKCSGANDLKKCFNNITVLSQHEYNPNKITTNIEYSHSGEDDTSDWCLNFKLQNQQEVAQHQAYSNKYWCKNIEKYIFMFYRIKLIELTHFCCKNSKLDIPSNMPSVVPDEHGKRVLAIYRGAKLYTVDGNNYWGLQGTHKKFPNCQSKGSMGEPIFFNPELTNITYTYQGLNQDDCYGVVSKRAIKNIYREDKNDRNAPVNLLLKLTTSEDTCRQSCISDTGRTCKKLSKTLQEKFQQAVFFYILSEYCNITENIFLEGSVKNVIYKAINENVKDTKRSVFNTKDYDMAVYTGLQDFMQQVLDNADNLRKIPMRRAVDGYTCDTKRHGPQNYDRGNYSKKLYDIFQTYGRDHYRESEHYNDRIYVEVQFQVLRAMQEVLKRVSKGTEKANKKEGMLKQSFKDSHGLSVNSECRIIGTWADYTTFRSRSCARFDLEVILALKEFSQHARHKTFSRTNSWSKFYRYAGNINAANAANAGNAVPPKICNTKGEYGISMHPEDAFEIMNRAKNFSSKVDGFALNCNAIHDCYGSAGFPYPYKRITGRYVDDRLILGNKPQGRSNDTTRHFNPFCKKNNDNGVLFHPGRAPDTIRRRGDALNLRNRDRGPVGQRNNNFANRNPDFAGAPFGGIWNGGEAQNAIENNNPGLKLSLMNNKEVGLMNNKTKDVNITLQRTVNPSKKESSLIKENQYNLGNRILNEIENDENSKLLLKDFKLFYKKIKNSENIIKTIKNISLPIQESSIDKISTNEMKDYFNEINDKKTILTILDFILDNYEIKILFTKKDFEQQTVRLLSEVFFDFDDDKYTDTDGEISSKTPKKINNNTRKSSSMSKNTTPKKTNSSTRRSSSKSKKINNTRKTI